MRQVAAVLIKYGFSDWLDTIPFPGVQELLQRAADPATLDLSREERIRLALTELGPTYIKIGQILATRSDLIGPDLSSELAKLQSHTAPDPPEVVAAIVERELGRPLTECFAEFEPEAFASASIAQVHRATLPSGEIVAVKVQRSGIQETVEADLSIVEALAHLVEKHSETLRAYRPVQLVNEFRRSIRRELDFGLERRNIDSFARNFDADETVHIPATWPELSSRRVLTMEYMEGLLGTQMGQLREAGVDLTGFANRGADVFLKMIFRDGFYHADPHPGNLMLLPGEVVGILDFGMVGRIDDALRDDLESLVAAITQGDVESLTNTLWGLSQGQPAEAREELHADLADLLNDANDPSGAMDVATALNGIFAVFRKYRIAPRPGLTNLLRTLVLLDGTARMLTDRFRFDQVLLPYRDEAIRRRFSLKRLSHRLQSHAVEWDRLLDTLPRDLNETMRKVRAGDFRIGLEHRHLDAVVNRLVLGIVSSSLFLGSSLLWSLKAPPLVYGVSFFGAAGYGVGLILGWRLFKDIHDSSKSDPKD